MRNLILVFLVWLFATHMLFAQTTYSKDYYLAKSKNQQSAGWLLLGGGTILIIAGIATGSGGSSDDLGYGSNFDSGMILVGAGVAAGIISIPLLASASKNKENAARMVSINSSLRTFQLGDSVRPVPLLSLCIKLK